MAAALALLEDREISAAVVDVNLPDGQLTPVAMFLLDRGMADIIQPAPQPEELRERYPDRPIYFKPTPPEDLIEALTDMMPWELVF